MNKIYIAISKPETLLALLKQKFPESEISVLDTKEQVSECMAAPFQLLITTHELIDLNFKSNFKSTIIIFDPSGELLSSEEKQIYVYKDMNTISNHIITKPLENGNSNDSHTSKTTERLNSVETKGKLSSGSSKNDKTQEEANKSRPVDLAEYPPKESEINSVISNRRFEKRLAYRRVAVPTTQKTIGVWSPISVGVSSFVINFAIYLSKLDLDVAVVEIPNNKQVLKSILTRYQSLPAKWSSFIQNYLSDELPAEEVDWLYKSVYWFPLGDHDNKFEWNVEIISELLYTAKKNRLVLVDFPSGNMDESALCTLSHLDELWIVIDDNFHQAHEWIGEIHEIIKEYKFKGKLIFNRAIPQQSRVKEIAESLNLPLIATLTNQFEIFQGNNYKKKPPIELFSNMLETEYKVIAENLLGTDKVQREKPNFLSQLKKIVRILG
ncbi:hypothetical protein [Mesobacillus zeae]|uniref:hypothetical protein n=1 Tax=Mesobacillus zeae TaxID=1917180 RepID=UPI003008666B